MKKIPKKFFDWIVSVVEEFNESPKDFMIHALIVLVVVGIWGLIMGIMEECR